MKNTLIGLSVVMFSLSTNFAFAEGTISIGSVKINGVERGNPVTQVPRGSFSHRQELTIQNGQVVDQFGDTVSSQDEDDVSVIEGYGNIIIIRDKNGVPRIHHR